MRQIGVPSRGIKLAITEFMIIVMRLILVKVTVLENVKERLFTVMAAAVHMTVAG